MVVYLLPGIFVMGYLVYIMDSYVIRCPEQTEWNIRAEIRCQNTTTYFCLYNHIAYSYEEGCTGPDWDRPGSKRVYSRNFNRKPCNDTRYQPINFLSKGNSDCIFRKSLCTEEGQLLFTNGTTKTDSTCRCDYKQGYAFVTVPRNKCSCRPSEEDCSCYLKKCQGIGYYLSADYECTNNITKKTDCPSMSENPSKDPHIDMAPTGIPRDHDSYAIRRKFLVVILVLVCIFGMIVSLLCAMFVERLLRCLQLSTKQDRIIRLEETVWENNSKNQDKDGGAHIVEDLKDKDGGAHIVEDLKDKDGGAHIVEDLKDKDGGAHIVEDLKDKDGGAHIVEDLKDKDGGAQIVEDLKNKKNGKLLIAAIDFGTTYSGYAFITKDEIHMGDNFRINCPTWAVPGGKRYKAPTTVLFRPNKTFHSFGYEADQFYLQNSDNLDLKEWYYFKHFKMKLYTDKDILKKDTLIEDNQGVGNTMKALDVFAAVISYFKSHMLDLFTIQYGDEKYVTNEDIHWVITVPAIWDLKAKQFMKDAAEKAGISDDQLTLALEPEVASLYCRKVSVSVESTGDDERKIAVMPIGSKYIVIDQGGGTTDITVHEVTGSDTLKEIHQACGGHYGGNTVNQGFFNFLEGLFGDPVIQEIRTKHPSEYFELMSTFEQRKTAFIDKNVSNDKAGVRLRVPMIWLKTFKAHTGKTLKEALPNTVFSDKVIVVNDKLRINNQLYRTFFDYSIKNVLRVFKELFNKPEIANISTLLAVGGYSDSLLLIGAIKNNFPNLNVIVPPDPDLAVLKGAVLYGFKPHSITERVSRYTYGVAMQLPYDQDKHLKTKISSVKGRRGQCMVDDIFDKHIEIGQTLRFGEFGKEHDFFPLVNDQKVAHFEMYASEDKNPEYTTDETCQSIGIYSVSLTRDSPQDGKLFLKLNGSGTDVIAVVREDATGKESRAHFSLF